VAAWLSETVLRGRGPGASGFESHRRGRIFSKEETSAGSSMCVYVFQGLTVGSVGFKSRPDGPPMVHGCRVVCVLCRPERRKERRGWALSRLLVEVF
jgi:hypothetical protein